MAKVIMIQGTMSHVGKSLITAGLCRIFKQDGYKVAPFKAQNMSGNEHILPEGKKMSLSQAKQAEACGKMPNPLMNPILLKPAGGMGLHVYVNGESKGIKTAADYAVMKKTLIPEIKRAYDRLAEENDIVVIEGAGSPAEINLNEGDIVNMGLAKLVRSPVILVGDIDMGGVFAQITGTLDLLEKRERDIVKAVLINKFRGDIDILQPGLVSLEGRVGKKVAGVLPYLESRDYDAIAAAMRENLNMGLIYEILDAGLLEQNPSGPLEQNPSGIWGQIPSGMWEEIHPTEIERRSFEIIESELSDRPRPDLAPIVKRVIHATADFSFAETIKTSDGAVYTALEAIRHGAIILTDTNMALAGINKELLYQYGGDVFCFMSDADVAERANKSGITRAAAAMEKSAYVIDMERPVIYAIGNAPTALARLCGLAAENKIKPALVIGAPVGFVNVEASKEILLRSGLPYIITEGRKGGSTVAAAIVNALLLML